MRTRRVWALVTIIVSVGGFAGRAAAQPGLAVGADVIFYGDNTEFHNPFREGETIFGAAARVEGRVALSDAVTLSLGVFGNQRFGSDDAFELVRPVLALRVAGRHSTFIFGTLSTPRAGEPPGPDRTGPHGLLPPMQRETLAFERPYEAGLQWLVHHRRFRQDAWLQWQKLNTPEHRERLDAGANALWRAAGVLSIPLQAHVVHEGGQLYAAGPVRDSFALASGIVLSNTPLAAPPATARRQAGNAAVSVELLAFWSRYTPDREAPDPTRAGGAFLGRAAVEKRGWRGHLLAWRGNDFVKDEGDPNYMSVRRDGTSYRGIRDYSEAGLTRSFDVAGSAVVEVSFRFHRIERHYEYSYRVLGVVRAERKIR